MLRKRILIAIPTYNRSSIVKLQLDSIAEIINQTPNLYMGLYDSSSGNDTEKVVRPYLSTKIFYKRYFPGASEEKGYDVVCSEGAKYDYIWFCSDRKVLKLKKLLPVIENDINLGVDLALFGNNRIKTDRRVITDRHEMGLLFFDSIDMGKTIIGRKIIIHMSKKDVFMKYFGSHFSLQASMMDYIGNNDFYAVQYRLKDQDVVRTGELPFVHEWANNLVWQWSISWCDTVEKLPSTFDNYKEEIISTNFMFSFTKILARRATGNEYRIRDIIKYKTYIKCVKKNTIPIYLAKAIPRPLLIIPYKLYKRIKNKLAEMK